MSSTTGNTTSPADPASRSPAGALITATIAVSIAHNIPEPWRNGERALVPTDGRRPLFIGREGDSFARQEPGEVIETGRLKGKGLSREQLEIRAEGDGARIHNVGSTAVYVNGTELHRDWSAHVRLPAVIEIYQHTVLVLIRWPLAFPAPHRLLQPHGPFGQVDSMGFCGVSAEAWQQRIDTVEAAIANRSVIIYGESGTGKGVIARAIHQRSHRANEPWAFVHCPDLEEGTASLRLNGGPANWPNPNTLRTIGPFEAARGGVALLDEIGEISETVQAILLSALAGFYLYTTETRPRPVGSGSSQRRSRHS